MRLVDQIGAKGGTLRLGRKVLQTLEEGLDLGPDAGGAGIGEAGGDRIQAREPLGGAGLFGSFPVDLEVQEPVTDSLHRGQGDSGAEIELPFGE